MTEPRAGNVAGAGGPSSHGRWHTVKRIFLLLGWLVAVVAGITAILLYFNVSPSKEQIPAPQQETQNVVSFDARNLGQSQPQDYSAVIQAQFRDTIRFRVKVKFDGKIPPVANLHFLVPEYGATRLPVSVVLDMGDTSIEQRVIILSKDPIWLQEVSQYAGYQVPTLLRDGEQEAVPVDGAGVGWSLTYESGSGAIDLTKWLPPSNGGMLLLDLGVTTYSFDYPGNIVAQSQR